MAKNDDYIVEVAYSGNCTRDIRRTLKTKGGFCYAIFKCLKSEKRYCQGLLKVTVIIIKLCCFTIST